MTDNLFGEDFLQTQDPDGFLDQPEEVSDAGGLFTVDAPSFDPVYGGDTDIGHLLSDGGTLPLFEEHSFADVNDALSAVFDIDVHGDPFGELANFDCQDYENSCAVATTGMIFKSMGYEFGEDFFADVFESLGSYDPLTGTNIHMLADNVNALADHAGLAIRASEIHGFTIEHLKSMLDSGDRLLVGVDSYELYREDGLTLAELSRYPDWGHAVQLTGILESDEGCFAVVNDPGIETGAGMEIPIDRFMDAAADFDFTAVKVA